MEKENNHYNLTEKAIIYGSAIAGGFSGLAATRYMGMPEYNGNLFNEITTWGASILAGLPIIASGTAIGMGSGVYFAEKHREKR